MVTVTQASTATRLADHWLPVFIRVREIFSPPGPTNAPEAAAEIMALIDAACGQSRSSGHPDETIDHARYAVVAWTDETAMTSAWPGALAWRLSPLQKHYYATTRAGVEFFLRLEALDPRDHASREVYALALASGFQGHFSTRRAGELEEQRHKWLTQLQADAYGHSLGAGQPLFPAARTVRGRAGRYRHVRSHMASLMLIALPVLILVLAYLAMDTLLAAKAADIIKAS